MRGGHDVAGPGCEDRHESWDCLEDTPLERRISVSLSVSDYTNGGAILVCTIIG